MSLRSLTQNEKGHALWNYDAPEICHSRTLLAGMQAEFGLDPRLKHSGGHGVEASQVN